MFIFYLYKPGDSHFTCRYTFPKEVFRSHTRVHCLGVGHSFDISIKLRRNDERLTNYNEYLRKGFRMNMDCKIAPGIRAVKYLANYLFSKAKSYTLTLEDLQKKLNKMI